MSRGPLSGAQDGPVWRPSVPVDSLPRGRVGCGPPFRTDPGRGETGSQIKTSWLNKLGGGSRDLFVKSGESGASRLWFG